MPTTFLSHCDTSPQGEWNFARILALIGWFLLAIILIAAAKVRFNLVPVAIADSDTWGWLNAALSWIGGAGFRETYEREWLYGAFVASCLRLTGSFAGLVVIQQLLGLLSGVLMWTTWRGWLSLLREVRPENPAGLILDVLAMPLGLLAIAFHLFNPDSIVFELSIRPEAIMAFVIFAQLTCIIFFCRFRWHTPDSCKSLVLGALSILLACILYILKPSWALAVPVTICPVFFGLFGSALPRSIRIATPLTGVILVLVSLWVPERIFFIRSTEPRVVLPMTLFTMNADSIHTAFTRELQSSSLNDQRRQFLESFLPELEREIANAKKETVYYRKLGFDPDYLMYRASLFPILMKRYGMSQKQIVDFCKKAFFQAWKANPIGMGQKVLRQMMYFVFPDRLTFQRARLNLAQLYAYTMRTTPDALISDLNDRTKIIYAAYRSNVEIGASSAGIVTSLRFFNQIARLLGGLAPIIEGAYLLAFFACLFWKPLHCLRLPGLVAGLIFAAAAGNALTIALVHALDNSRYRASYGSVLSLALAAMLVFSIATVMYSAMLTRKFVVALSERRKCDGHRPPLQFSWHGNLFRKKH